MHKTTTTVRRFADYPTDYAGLVAMFMPRKIHDQVELENTAEIVSMMSGHRMNADQGDYYDLLVGLVRDYERETLPPLKRTGTPAQRLKVAMEAAEMSTADLGRLIGDGSLASKLLNGKQQLSKRHIKLLAARFKLSADYFL